MPAASLEPILADLESRAADYFLKNAHPETGFVLDRAPSLRQGKRSEMASIAATGYLLSLLPPWAHAGTLSREKASAQARRILENASRLIPAARGLMSHFVHWETGARWRNSESSTLDTAIFLNGAIVSAMAFDGCRELCDALLARVRWSALLVADPKTGKQVLSYGISPAHDGKPEAQIPHGADRRSTENLMPVLLACGAEKEPLDERIHRNMLAEFGEVAGRKILNPSHALFTSYFGLGWADLRGLHDPDGVDYDANARAGALANREACRTTWSTAHATYRKDNGGWWGLSAGDSPKGYVARGPLRGDEDGVVWPTAALAALPWASDEFAEDLPRWRASASWEKALGTFGLAPFSLDKDWWGQDIIGIDVGSLLLGLAIRRDDAVRKLWMSHPVPKRAIEKLEFSKA